MLLGTEDAKARQAVLADPQRYISAPSTPRVQALDPRLSSGGNEVRRYLLQAEGVAGQLIRNCQMYAPTGLNAQDAVVLVKQVEQTMRTVRRLGDQLTQLLADSCSSSEAGKRENDKEVSHA
jgi:hypothetical protein